MCTTDLYTYVYPDGRREKSQPYTKLCSSSRYGLACANEAVYKHTPQQVPFPGSMPSSAPVNPSFLSAQYPPTPSYSSRSSTPNYRSGDESDRSGYRSGSSTSKHSRSKRTSTAAPVVYVNGQPIYESNNTTTTSASSPRTPPQQFTTSYTAPSSPSAPYIVEASPRRRASNSPSSHQRPIIHHDGRRHIDIDIRDAAPSSSRRTHSRRTSSNSSYDYHYESDAARTERHRLREAEREQRRAEERASRLHDRIEKANQEIADRPPVPMHNVDPASYSPQREAELVEAVRRMNLKEEKKQRRRQEKEDEAQKERLRDRLSRRATVSSGSGHKHRVLYDDGSYRYE